MSFRLLREDHRFFRADDRGAVVGQRRQRAGLRAGGDEDVLGFERLLRAVGRDDADFARCFDRTEAADVVDLVLFKEEFDAAGEFVGDLAGATDHGGPVVGKVIELQAELRRLLGQRLVDFGVLEERFGRDAAPVEAGAASAVDFDAGDFFAELGGADGGDVAGRAAADDDEIVGHGIRNGVAGGRVGAGPGDVKGQWSAAFEAA